MKKALISLLAIATLFVSCNTKEAEDTKLKKVSIDPESVEILEGETKTLEIITEPANAVYNSVSWSSSNKEVATISRRGVLSAVAAGSATITADVDGITATCEVTVTPNITPVSGVTLDQEELNLEINESATLSATVAPEAAANKDITWRSSDEKVATVTDGFVTAINKGTCDIIVKTDDGGFEATCHVTVIAPAAVYKCNMPNADWSKNSYIVFNKDCTKGYFYGLKNDNTLRTLYELDLTSHSIGWSLDLTNSEKGWSNNGGDLCVNPTNGDIICCNQCEVFCVKSDGTKRWSIAAGAEGTTLGSGNGGAAIMGCGPAMNNDCSVIFACINKKLFAIKAADGTILDKLEGMTGNFQFIVYGQNKIVYHINAATNGIGFVSFADNKFTVDKTIDSPMAKAADITSGAMTKDQKKAFFMGEAASVCVDIESQSVTGENKTSIGKGFRWAPCITSKGYLCMSVVLDGANSAIARFNTASSIASEDNGEIIFKYSGYNSALNFEGICADSADNLYCFINDCKGVIDEGVNKSYLIKLIPGASEYDTKILATIDCVAQGTYQGQFNYGGNNIVAVQGNPGTVYMFELQTSRAKGWSGPGGDAQGTKNANLVYAE